MPYILTDEDIRYRKRYINICEKYTELNKNYNELYKKYINLLQNSPSINEHCEKELVEEIKKKDLEIKELNEVIEKLNRKNIGLKTTIENLIEKNSKKYY